MENYNYQDINQICNTNIMNSLNNLYESNGRDKKAWEDLLISLYNSNIYLGVIYFFNQKIINCPANPITLDIIDFLIDYGSINLIRELSKIEFMKNVFNLLKRSSGSSPDVQKKGIYLTKKWNEKANEYPNENFMGFVHNYIELNNMGITLPPPGFKIYTYEQYITQYEANIMKSKAENNPNLMNNNYSNNNFNNIYNNNIYNNNYLNDKNYNNNFEKQPDLDNFYNRVQSMNSNTNSKSMNNKESNEFDKDISVFQKDDKSENPFNELNDKNKVKFPDNFQHDFSDFKSSENINNPNSENNQINNNKGNDLNCAPLSSSFQTPLNSKSNNQNNFYNNEIKNNNRFNNNYNNNDDYNYGFNYKNDNLNNEDKNNNNKNKNKEKNKYIKEIGKVGGMMKKGIFNMGKAVRNSTIKGYNFIKNKVENKDKEEEIHDEVWGDYMDNIDSNSNYNQNNFNSNNNYNNYNQGNNYNNNYNNYNQGNNFNNQYYNYNNNRY